ncbi:hypothetical protein DPM19_04100 [Actinomadura craniellae]|uniref:Rv2525c-like glycoside hydrolase-like domain-containing protein n=1 Tax=Actinomadura craniellae TaxID=2231787 RepID=A0A365HB09_9ACTN|nr:glycoside hydrolase domain-containing protein [Actinomadura craniellae]RAY16116.1 hypothetical protein DPM19_04100 [Actinomadura craniellae]
MADEMVRTAQQWVNATYQNVPGYQPVEENGRTGWSTVFALTRALQHELGLSPLSDSFGPATLAALSARWPVIDHTAGPANLVKIVQSALYCKGYPGSGISGSYDVETANSVRRLKEDTGVIGVLPGFGLVPKVFKALLTMDAYVVLSGGSPRVREIQKWLNSTYVGRRDFFIIPCDGHFSRDVQKALVRALQYELGMDDDTANGRFGPGTQTGIRNHAALNTGAADSTRRFVRLFQAAMVFNTWDVPFDGRYTAAVAGTVAEFQRFACLPRTTGAADFPTWASLLVSTGDPTRRGSACDCVTTVTPARAQALRAAGYTTVGRYLSNVPGSKLNKKIQPGELQALVAAGLAVFPIYQTKGGTADYFSAAQGADDALAAVETAREHGFQRGTTIYFAVDFDAMDHDITQRIIPHFRMVSQRLAQYGGEYRVGVYGPRNVCRRLAKEGLTVSSFVSDMSTGFSGNLGFPLPRDWAFDQIATITVGTGDGHIEIDNNIASGRDHGQNRFAPAPPGRPALDLPFDMSRQPALTQDIVAYMNGIGWGEGVLEPLTHPNSPPESVSMTLGHDELITGLSRAYRVRKFTIQSLLLTEVRTVTRDDPVVDLTVRANYLYEEKLEEWMKNPVGDPPAPPLVRRTDSSTGPGAIFAKTAIKARNHAASIGLIPDERLNAADWHDVWKVWKRLNEDTGYNITTLALVTIEAAHELGITTDRLRYGEEETRRILARYNGTGSAADGYGTKVLGIYRIFEKHRTPAG